MNRVLLLAALTAPLLFTSRVLPAQDGMPSVERTPAPVHRIPPPGAAGVPSSGVAAAKPSITMAALPPVALSPGENRFGLRRVGTNRPVPLGAKGDWLTNHAGQRFWRMAIRSTQAKGMRVHFQNFHVGAGQVWIHDGNSVNGGAYFGPYTDRGVLGDGDFWTEMVFAENIFIEYLPSAGNEEEEAPFTISEVFHLWDSNLDGARSENVSCFLDSTCYMNNTPVASFSGAVAYLIINGFTCSGTLLNSKDSQVPYFLTAGHCIENDQGARSMLAFFGYRSQVCGGPVQSLQTYPQVPGAQLLSRALHSNADGNVFSDTPDYAFVRLSGFPAAASIQAGWTTSSLNGTDRYLSVSHPRNQPQRFASGLLVRDLDNFGDINMTQGAIDHGSSGSGLANSSTQVVGLLSGGSNASDVSACDTTDRTGRYTRFSTIFPAIRPWLEADPVRPVAPKATITSPPDGAALTGTSVTFSWNVPTSATGYTFAMGLQAGGSNLVLRDMGTATALTVTGLPTDGRTLYVRLTTRSAAGSEFADYLYRAFSSGPVTQPPVIPINAIVSAAASSITAAASGGWVSIYGQNFGPAPGRSWGSSDFVNGQLPISLNGTSVKVNGRAAAVSYVSPIQINFQAPDDSTNGTVTVEVTTSGGTARSTMTLRPVAPALFMTSMTSGSSQYAAATHGNGAAVLPGNPAKPGETIALWGTSCGASSPARPAGQLVASPAALVNSTTARLGGTTSVVAYAGIAGAGLCQFNIVVPNVADGDQPIVLTVGGVAAQDRVILPVRR